MIRIIDAGSPQAVGIKVSGKIEKQDIERVYAHVDEKLARADRLAIYVEVDEFKGISISAMIEDIRRGLPKIRRFSKKAVVSSSGWHKTLVEVGDKLFPSLEVKHFSPERKQEAMAWVTA